MRTDLALAALAAGERVLAAALDDLAARHPDDADVAVVARDLAGRSREHVADLTRVAGARGDRSPLPAVPRSAVASDDPRPPLLADLRDAYVTASGVGADWDVLRQVALASRDDALAALVEAGAPHTEQQVTWLRAKLRESAAQGALDLAPPEIEGGTTMDRKDPSPDDVPELPEELDGLPHDEPADSPPATRDPADPDAHGPIIHA
ncbi:hypothetical protein [Cellulomonas sp. URHB0016]